jgi:hypothetical protein
MIKPEKKVFLLSIPLLFALLATFGAVFVTESSVLRETGGIFMYPLDDPFIHMELARNLAFHGVWGINGHEFASASSSLLYTLLLAAVFKVFSVHVIIPFIINCIAGFLLLLTVDRWLQKQGMAIFSRLLILLLVVFFVPLPAMIISGMEHTLQCLFSFLFITRFSEWLQQMKIDGDKKKWKLPASLIVYGMLVTTSRYEGMFLVAIACLLLLYNRKIKTAFQLGLLALLPMIIFGIVSIALGSYFLPNSVLVKSESMPFSPLGIIRFFAHILIYKLTVADRMYSPPGISLLATQRLLIIIPLVHLLFITQIKQKLSYHFMFIILLLCSLLHLSFAATGWFYRYEAYLIFCAVVLLSVILRRFGKDFLQHRTKYEWFLTALLLLVLGLPLVLRSISAYSKSKDACINIYQQQYQMAKFIRNYYDTAIVAANDIGAISYYTGANIVDLWGLGNIEIARSKKGKYWTPVFLDSLVRKKQVKMIMVYDEWFDQDLLNRWKKVATWQVPDNVILGGDTVSFYVINEEDGAALKQKLQQYQPSLPAVVNVVYK